MGILGLSKLIADIAPFAIKENEIKNYFGKQNSILVSRLTGDFVFKREKLFAGRKIAIDASMCLYQFLIAVRAEGLSIFSSTKTKILKTIPVYSTRCSINVC